MAAFNFWGNVGNAAYAVPMVRLTPADPTLNTLLGWNANENAVDYLPVFVNPVTGDSSFAGNMYLAPNKAYHINSLQVVGARRTGWAAPTGTATRTTFVTSTVTLPQLAERVKALIDDLTAHGLIGA